MNWFLYDRDLPYERVNAFDVSEHFSKHIRAVLIEAKIKFFLPRCLLFPNCSGYKYNRQMNSKISSFA